MGIEQIIRSLARDTPDWTPEPGTNRLKSSRESKTLEDFDSDFVAVIKMVISGLTPNSGGNGRNRATVTHGYTIKSINKGRYKRQPREFLCVQSKNGFGVTSRIYPKGDPKGDITCPKCYTVIKRHSLSQCRDPEIANLIDIY
ncbi:hypothetical protein D0962_22860 [Leptolyngbyaceae cyanobacterium CCMR0082]|uniref:Uncharacterized protein n=1 Tax=Adonisia turfae CCMR0082 TaxID=2304604 RepID=A0A6M0SD12_9CYAN|nr:hypothetical protein [Adonisia turfae]NEZ65562.1 hypothetical protein [Adonisia turfae CCMR0082]